MKTICNSEVGVNQSYEALEITDDEQARVFDYVINKKRAKAKLLKGAKRIKNLEVELKNGCVNLLFCDGAYFEIVLPLMRSWNKKVDEVFVINNTETSWG